ncbi:MAG: hypothetical protein KKF56_00020 [Nanoarchaeota archaeon]|nr:hypothetical protein [Nanoarchaeota archaeon]
MAVKIINYDLQAVEEQIRRQEDRALAEDAKIRRSGLVPHWEPIGVGRMTIHAAFQKASSDAQYARRIAEKHAREDGFPDAAIGEGHRAAEIEFKASMRTSGYDEF